MTDPLTALMKLETELSERSDAMAALLSHGQPSNQTAAIDATWQLIAQQYGPYRAALANLQAAPITSAKEHIDLIKHGAFRASMWDKIPCLLSRQTTDFKTPLIETPKLKTVDRRDDLTSYLTNALHYLANPIAEDRAHSKINQFPDIPLSGAYFINLMQAAYRIQLAQFGKRRLRFLDVGCGGGTKMMIAAHFFEQVSGLEHNRAFAENARRALGAIRATDCSVFITDAFHFDCYADFDIIYFYRPI